MRYVGTPLTTALKPRTLLRLFIATAVVAVGGTLVLYQHFAVGAPRPSVPLASLAAPTQPAGTILSGHRAPLFQLRDQSGALISLAHLEGHPVVLSFLDATCTNLCPITAQFLSWTGYFLGRQARDVTWLAISVNPKNTPAQAAAFVRKHHVTIPLHMLLGTRAQLAPLWRRYGIYVSATTLHGDIEHSIFTYLIDGQGREREVLDQTFDSRLAAHDIRALIA